MNVLRYYSLLWLAIPILVIIAAILVRNKARPVEWLAYGGVTLALVAAWLALRPVATPLMGEAADIQKQIGAGTPVLLEFQSPYWIACNAIKPVVDGLEKELDGRLIVIRIDIQTQVGRELIPVYGFEYTPTFILFDSQGSEIWRQIGGLDTEQVRALLGE